jgi:hypothetical protein
MAKVEFTPKKKQATKVKSSKSKKGKKSSGPVSLTDKQSKRLFEKIKAQRQNYSDEDAARIVNSIISGTTKR